MGRFYICTQFLIYSHTFVLVIIIGEDHLMRRTVDKVEGAAEIEEAHTLTVRNQGVGIEHVVMTVVYVVSASQHVSFGKYLVWVSVKVSFIILF